MGNTAYSNSGGIVDECRPVFVKRDEYLNRYRSDRIWQRLCPDLESRV